MIGSTKPVSSSTKSILLIAIFAALLALGASAIVFDEETEFGTPTEQLFSLLLGFNLGPVLMIAGVAALVMGQRPHSRNLVPVAIAVLVFGAFMSWLFFVETTELPDFWPY